MERSGEMVVMPTLHVQDIQHLAKDTYGNTITLARCTAYSAGTAIPTACNVLLAIHREVPAPSAPCYPPGRWRGTDPSM